MSNHEFKLGQEVSLAESALRIKFSINKGIQNDKAHEGSAGVQDELHLPIDAVLDQLRYCRPVDGNLVPLEALWIIDIGFLRMRIRPRKNQVNFRRIVKVGMKSLVVPHSDVCHA